MNRARDEFLSGTRLAKNQHRRIGAGDFVYIAEDFAQRIAPADNIVRPDYCADLFAQVFSFERQGTNLVFRLEPIVDVSENQRVERFATDVETRQRRLSSKFFTAVGRSRKAPGNPQEPLAIRARVELDDQTRELLTRIGDK